MLYYTQEARNSAINNIKKKISIVMSMPNGVLSYTDAREIVDYLVMLENVIQGESKKESDKKEGK